MLKWQYNKLGIAQMVATMTITCCPIDATASQVCQILHYSTAVAGSVLCGSDTPATALPINSCQLARISIDGVHNNTFLFTNPCLPTGGNLVHCSCFFHDQNLEIAQVPHCLCTDDWQRPNVRSDAIDCCRMGAGLSDASFRIRPQGAHFRRPTGPLLFGEKIPRVDLDVQV